jgi:hypothetical protein
MARKPEYVIDLELDEPSRSSPALGQVDKMLKQSLIETQSLQVVRHMMLRDMVERAKVTGVSKFNAAANLRERHRQELPAANGHEPANQKKRLKYGERARQLVHLAKTSITGPRLNLFILELLDRTGDWITGHDIMETLKKTGKANHLNRLSGVYGLMSTEGFVKHEKKLGYKITAAGRHFTQKLRSALERDGGVVPGGYLAPETYKRSNKTRFGYKTMKHHMKYRGGEAHLN